MTKRKTVCNFSGTILGICALAYSGGYEISGTAFAAGADSKSAIGAPGATGPPQTLLPRTYEPMVPRLQTPRSVGLQQRPAINEQTVGQIGMTPEMPSIMSVQRALSRLGYDPGPIDGLIGPRTNGAIVAYEEQKGWAASGTVSQRIYDRLVADLFPNSHAPSVSGQIAGEGVALHRTQSPANFPASNNTENAASVPSSLSAQASAGTAAKHLRTEAAERQSRLQFAVADFYNVLRATSQFVVRLFTGPKSRDTATPIAKAEIDNPPNGPTRVYLTETGRARHPGEGE